MMPIAMLLHKHLRRPLHRPFPCLQKRQYSHSNTNHFDLSSYTYAIDLISPSHYTYAFTLEERGRIETEAHTLSPLSPSKCNKDLQQRSPSHYAMRRRSAPRRILLLLLLSFFPFLLLVSGATPRPAPPVNRAPETAAEIEALTANKDLQQRSPSHYAMRRLSAPRRILLLLLLSFFPFLLLVSGATPRPAPPVNRTPETATEIEALTANKDLQQRSPSHYAMRRRSAPRRILLLLLLSFFPFLLVSGATPRPAPPVNRTPETAAEIEALTAFRLALQDPLGALSGWDPALPTAPCTWRSVMCYSTSILRVVELRLPLLRLSGPISGRISSLPLLLKLSLRSNLFDGPIPSSLSSLRRLRSLFLQYNSLSGPLPSSLLSNLSSLQILNTAGNHLSGAVPASLPSSLGHPLHGAGCIHEREKREGEFVLEGI